MTACSALHDAGLDGIAEVQLDRVDADATAAIGHARECGLLVDRLTVSAADPDRIAAALRARELQEAVGGFRTFAPLPRTMSISAPSTGYDDVKGVAIARLLVTGIESIQVDWSLYGPKLAQVALTVGADDVDGVAAVDPGILGARRSPIEEIKGNIRSAGLEPVERNARFEVHRLTRIIRLGAVDYLNARPLVYGLELRNDLFTLRFDVPSKCAALLHEGSIDLGMIPSIEFLRGAPYRIVPGAGIISEGPVASVALFTQDADRKDQDDCGGHELTDIECAAAPVVRGVVSASTLSSGRCIQMPSRCCERCDAALLIGDPALFLDYDALGATKVDLGSEWFSMTGLPFVWAFWAGRPEALTPEAVGALLAARDGGVAASDAVAASYCGPDRAARGSAYLRENIRYTLGEREEEGLRMYYELAGKHGLVPTVVAAGFLSPMSTRDLADKVRAGGRLDRAEALELYTHAPTALLGRAGRRGACAQAPRQRHHLHHRPQRELHERLRRAVQLLRVLPAGRVERRVRRSGSTRSSARSTRRFALGGGQLLLQGGHNPDLPLAVVRRSVSRREAAVSDVPPARALAAGSDPPLAAVPACRCRR